MTARRLPRALPLLPALLFIAACFLYPVLLFAWRSLGETGPVSLVQYTHILSTPVYLDVIGTTFGIAVQTTLLSVLGGYVLAYVIASTASGMRGVLTLVIVLSFWTSTLIRSYGWILILGRFGVINASLMRFGLIDQPLHLLYSRFAVLLGMVHVMLPFATFIILSSMQAVDANLRRAAGTLGAHPAPSFLLVFLPLTWPGIASAALLVFINSLGFFITPTLLGSVHETLIGQEVIQQIQEVVDWPFGAALSVLLTAASVATFVIADRLLGITGGGAVGRGAVVRGPVAAAQRRAVLGLLGWIASRYVAASRLGTRLGVTRGEGRTGRAVTAAVAFGLFLYLLAPLVVLVPGSFTRARVLSWPPEGFSTRWYAAVLGSADWYSAAWVSILLAGATACACLLLALPAAYGLSRHPPPGRGGFVAVLLAPTIVPHIAIAAALFYFFARIGLLASGAIGTAAGLLIGHTVIAIPYVVIVLLAVFRSFPWELNDAAMTLGASPATAIRRITLPIVKLGVLSAFLFAFVTSFDELTVAIFVSAGAVSTFPKKMWDEALQNPSPILSAASMLVVLFVGVLVTIAYRAQAGRAKG